jgi:hypothetical protein
MRHSSGALLTATLALFVMSAAAGQSENHDPVRDAQRHKDCVAENIAKHDGRTQSAITAACDKAIADGTYQDPNISLDGMIKSPQPQM